MSASISDPFLLSSYALPARSQQQSAPSTSAGPSRSLFATHTHVRATDRSEGYVTVAVQGDGVHVLDVSGHSSSLCFTVERLCPARTLRMVISQSQGQAAMDFQPIFRLPPPMLMHPYFLAACQCPHRNITHSRTIYCLSVSPSNTSHACGRCSDMHNLCCDCARTRRTSTREGKDSVGMGGSAYRGGHVR